MVVLLFSSLLLLFFVNFFFSKFYVLPSRYSVSFDIFLGLFYSGTLYGLFFLCLISSLVVINLFGNVPGVLSPSMFYFLTASVSVVVWLSLMVVVGQTQLNSFLAHMLPYGAPSGLMLVLPLIEIFSHLIRPFTLMVRLSTNLSSGHIMLYMFSFFSLSSLSLTVLIGFAIVALLLLEVIISALQAYIFSSLALLYVSETL